MNTHLWKHLRQRKHFTDLDIGELFVINTNDQVVMKVSNREYGLPLIAGTRPDNYPSVDVSGVGPLFYYSAIPMGNNPLVISPPPTAAPDGFESSIESLPTVFPGSDPILGYPYTPIQYQLFIRALTAPEFPSVNGSGPPAQLYWTVPSMVTLSVTVPHLGVTPWRIYFAVPNDITQSCSIDIPPHDSFRYIYPINYIWVKEWVNATTPPTRPVGPGTAVPGGDQFNGRVAVAPNGTIQFDAQTLDALDHYVIERGVNSLSNPTVLDNNLSGAATTFDDTSDRIIGQSYFYRLTAIPSIHVSRPVPFNNVGLISPYSFSIDQSTTPRKLRWTAPDPTQWPTTPADAQLPPNYPLQPTTCPSPP